MSITTNIDQGSAFTALSSAPGLITTIFGKNDVVKYISGTIKSLGYEPCELIGSVEYCVLNDDHDRFYLRSHRNGCDILMETIALTEMSNGDKIMLERIVNYEGDLVPQQQNQLLVPTPAISKVPHEIVQDFLVNGSVGIHWVNSDGTIVWANKADMDICGYTPDEYIGSPIAAYYDDDKVLKDILRKLRANQILKDYPARLKHRDGSIRYVLIDSSTNFDKNGNFINTRCFTRDVTEAHKLETIKKEAELAQSKSIQKALDMKSLFLAQMSHDIRTPLNGVIGMTSLLQTTELTKEQQEFIAIIESSSSFLLTLIQDILDH
jgi:PAS domain S-box-containing protein